MTALRTKRAPARPLILLSESDHDRIADLALRIEGRAPEVAGLLLGELERAKLCPEEKMPRDVVRLGSEIAYLDSVTGTMRCVTLVLPPDADIQAGRVSIATSVGAGLIGLSVGDEISWPCPDGRPRTLKILEVRHP